jgi:DNA-binding MarR family transcriptional regulator
MSNNKIAMMFFKVIPNSMSLIRSHIKNASGAELSFPQFRVLANINRGLTTISEIAANQCISQPGISKLVDGLVVDGLLKRSESTLDRRVIQLELTKLGREKFKIVKSIATKNFEPNLNILTNKELSDVMKSLECLEKFFNKVQKEII